MTRCKLLVTVGLVVLTVALAACGAANGGEGAANGGEGTANGGEGTAKGGEVATEGGAQLDLVIGSLLPLTGEQSSFGTPWQKAADVAVAQINQAIEEAGADHTVEIMHEDTQGDPQAAVQAARKVAAQGASCISGPSSSAEAIPVANSVSLRDGILQITTATSDEITGLDDPDGLVNRTTPPDSFQGTTLAVFVEQELGGASGKTVNVGARNDAYGSGLAERFRAAWEDKGGEVGAEVIYDPKQPNYDSEASQIAKGNPDAWLIVDFPETYSKMGPALVRAGGWSADGAFTADGLYSEDLADIATDDAVIGMRGTKPGSPQGSAAAQAFDSVFSSSEPADVGRQAFDAQVFDNVVLCYLAAVAAGSTEAVDMGAVVRDITRAPGQQFTFEELPEAIEALENGEDIDYEGASGSIEMDDHGDANAAVYDTYVFTADGIDVVGQVSP